MIVSDYVLLRMTKGEVAASGSENARPKLASNRCSVFLVDSASAEDAGLDGWVGGPLQLTRMWWWW